MRALPSAPAQRPETPADSDVVSVPTFIQSLSDSGLLSAQQVQQLAQHQALGTPQLARSLVQNNRLTAWQANQLAKGKPVLLGNYVLLERLGAGGMGAVYKARHRELQRVVALKVLAPALADAPRADKRFQREIQAAGKLQHPNVVAAYDADTAGGCAFLVMEYVDGTDLAQWVRRHGPVSVAHAVHYILQAARGLEHAHRNGIIHRDIKPSNLLRTAQGDTVKIADLGIARVIADAPEELTGTGHIVGTCDYMAPEQALNSKHADERSDIYSLGCTLYFLLTGQPMYGGETAMEKFIGHRDQPIPSLRQARPDVPRALEQIYRRMVAKAPAERQPSMRDVIVDLEALAACVKLSAIPGPAGSATPASGVQPPARASGLGRRTLVLGSGAALLLVVAVGALGSWWLLPAASSVPSSQQTLRPTAPASASRTTSAAAGPDAALARVRGLPAPEQVRAVADLLRQHNPGFDGKVEPEIEKDQVIGLRFSAQWVSDIGPVAALPHLKRLECNGVHPKKSKLANLAPLKGLRLTHLAANNTSIVELQPLQGMPLTSLDCSYTLVTDLGPLRGLPLSSLNFTATRVADLTPLRGMTLATLQFESTRVKDLGPLEKMPLQSLKCNYNELNGLAPLRHLPLKELSAPVRTEQDLAVVRSLTTLEKINNLPAAAFWKKQPAP
ncbi:MAG: protein kinase [Planctomycetia bacterium]|nr:protein kinase [Planctomycetia bacterium]